MLIIFTSLNFENLEVLIRILFWYFFFFLNIVCLHILSKIGSLSVVYCVEGLWWLLDNQQSAVRDFIYWNLLSLFELEWVGLMWFVCLRNLCWQSATVRWWLSFGSKKFWRTSILRQRRVIDQCSSKVAWRANLEDENICGPLLFWR